MQESQADGLRDLDYKILKKLSSRSTAPGRSRSTKTSRGQRAASSAIPVQPHGNEQKQRQANRRLAPNWPRNAKSHIVPPPSPSFASYPALPVPLQPQGYLGQEAAHTSQAPSMTNPQAWSAYTTQATAAIASPAQIQHSTQLEYMTTLLPDAGRDGSARHIFHASAQQGQSSPPIPGTYPVTHPASTTNVYATHRATPDFPSTTRAPGPSQTRQQGGTAAYGPHSAGYYHAAQDGFNGWADNAQNRE
jgi:hypothetical protein